VVMEPVRILILGQTKENSYEIRNLLDSRRFELEIALNKDVGKTVLTTRRMNLLIIHTEMLGSEEIRDFFQFLDEQGISIPMMLLGEEASRMRQDIPSQGSLECFDKPYAAEEVLSYIDHI